LVLGCLLLQTSVAFNPIDIINSKHYAGHYQATQ
jgi:hypothetical protein